MLGSTLTDVRRPTATGKRRLVIGLAVLTAVCLPAALYALFSRQPTAYDDEGFFLVAIKLVAGGQRLYDDVAVGYGPVYFLVFVPLAHALGGLSHDEGRMTVLVLWLAGCWLAALASFRLTGSRLLALIAFALCFRASSTFDLEPMNPAPLLNVLLLAMVCVAAVRRPSPRSVAGMAALAVLALLVKVNIGAYAGSALVFALLATATGIPRAARWAGGIVLLGVAPLVVMGHDLSHVEGYAFLVVASGMAVTVATFARPYVATLELRRGWLAVVLAVVVTVGAVVLAAMLFFGSTPAALWQNVVVLPSRQRDVFTKFVPIPVRPTFALIALLPFALRGSHARLVAGARVASGVVIGIAILFVPFEQQSFAVVEWGLPVAWLAVVSSDDQRFARVFVAALAVTTSLYAYPVAGSQRSFAALMLIPLAALLVADGLRELQPRAVAVVGAAVLVAVAWGAAGAPINGLSGRYDREVAFPFPGATHLHVTPYLRDRVAWISRNVRGCSTFVPVLGMNSMYLWTLKPPPGFLQQAWPLTLDRHHQLLLLKKLAPDRNACLLVNPTLFTFWSNGRPLAGPLFAFATQRFHLWRRSPLGDEIWVRKDRPASS